MIKNANGKKGRRGKKSVASKGTSFDGQDLFSWSQDRHAQSVADSREMAKKIVTIDEARVARAKRVYKYAPRHERAYRSRGLGSIIPKLTRQAIGSTSSLDADLQIYWAQIVGEQFAASTYPRKSRFDQQAKRIGGVLELTVQQGYAAFIAHAKGQLLDKLNAYLGLGTFRDVKFKEGLLPTASKGAEKIKNLTKPLGPIDLNDEKTRQRLGFVRDKDAHRTSASPNRASIWLPKPARRHRLDLLMDDQGGTGVSHKPLADALTFLGASLANQDQSD